MKKLNGLKTKLGKSQKGFTLIEIAIVLVIIGLLLGGVLQGQQLIENSRVKSAVNEFKGIAAAAFSYQDRYGRLPGDDTAGDAAGDATDIKARGSNWNTANMQAGNANGNITAGLADVFAGTGEVDIFFQHLRAAGFITGDPDLTGTNALPSNRFGGLIGISTVPVGGGLAGTKICMGNVGGAAAIALDSQLDDSNGATGNLRATLDVNSVNLAPTNVALAAAYSEDSVYTICLRI